MLIKAAEFEASPLGRQAFNLSDIAVEAEQIIAEAERRRDEMLSAVDAQIAAKYEKARQEGCLSGHEQGLAEGRKAGHEEALVQAGEQFTQRCEQTYESLCGILSGFEQSKDRILWQAEQDTIRLALAIAEKVINKVIAADPGIVAGNLKAVMKLVVHATDVAVTVHPDDLEYLKQMANENEGVFGKYHSITFQSEETLSPGSCCVSTEHGGIDGAIETQIQRIAAQLLMPDTTDPATVEEPTGDGDEQESSESE